MNRPNIKNYEEWPFEMPYEYRQDLEKYCDQLELTNKLLQEMHENMRCTIKSLQEEKIDGLILTDENAMKHKGTGWVSLAVYNKKLDEINKLQETNRELKEKLSYEEVATDNECRAKEIYLKALDEAIEELQDAHFTSLYNMVIPYKEKAKWKEYLLHKAITQEEKDE